MKMFKRLSHCAAGVAAAALGGLGLFAQPARAALIAYDSFDYTAGAGALANQSGGTGWSSTDVGHSGSPGQTTVAPIARAADS